MNAKIKIVIAGVTGYVGHELVKLVSQHPELSLDGVVSNTPKAALYLTLPILAKESISLYKYDELALLKSNIDVILLATPPQISIDIIKKLKNTSIKIIDLSGAFRLSQQELNDWYNLKHEIPEFINGAEYALSPWSIKNTAQHHVLANPGCYATCVLMSLIPLLQANIIKENNIIIDAKSGVSGAGKSQHDNLMYCEMNDNFFPYKVGKHQHIPEIKKALKNLCHKKCDFTFITSMLPIKKGIAMSIYADIQGVFESDAAMSGAIKKAYDTAYDDYPLVEVKELNQGQPLLDHHFLSLKNVVGTAKTHIAYFIENKKLIVFSTIDNTMKGAASQAIENINALYQLPLHTGLLKEECIA